MRLLCSPLLCQAASSTGDETKGNAAQDKTVSFSSSQECSASAGSQQPHSRSPPGSQPPEEPTQLDREEPRGHRESLAAPVALRDLLCRHHLLICTRGQLGTRTTQPWETGTLCSSPWAASSRQEAPESKLLVGSRVTLNTALPPPKQGPTRPPSTA